MAEQQLRVSDLIRLLHTPRLRQAHHDRRIQPKTIHKAVRGGPVQTRTLELIAVALNVPLTAVLSVRALPTSHEPIAVTDRDVELLLRTLLRMRRPDFRARLLRMLEVD